MKTKKTIFITGIAGFIGFHLARHLHGRGDRVFGLDNFNSYYDPLLKRKRAEILKEAGIEIIEGDIVDGQRLIALLRDRSPSHLVHLAAQAGVRYSLTNPQAYIKANIEGFLNILEACRQHPQTKLIYASSSSVYGRNRNTPFAIEDRTDEQASLYGVSKKTNELMANTYHHLYNIAVTGLRFFTVYGPWGRPDMAYFSFAKAIDDGLPIDLYNQGKMRRDFTFIDDIVDGAAAAIDLGADCEIFNLGNNQPVDLLNFVEILEKSLGKQAIKRFAPMQPGDVLETYASIEKSSQQLNFFPKTSLEEGIPQFIKWFHDHRDLINSFSNK